MEALILCYRGEPLREFPLEARPVEVGRGRYCDIVVHDAGVAERELLVHRSGGTVVAYDLRQGGRLGRPRAVPPGEPVPVGAHHTLVRVPEAAGPGDGAPSGHTEPIAVRAGGSRGAAGSEGDETLAVLVGRGAEARRVALGERPVTVGTDPGNDVALADRTVSAHHCRLEPVDGELWVRDLGSRNGTWVGGVRVESARVGPGVQVRVGRTDLRLVPQGSPGDGRAAGLVAESPAMLGVLAEVERYARLSWPVLVQGDSGSGKEGVARALHDRGPRARRPFVALNAGGLPRELVESELFGHERGAFTGAVGTHRGVFERANGGTLFLDEIGELPPSMQARLLRVLETWEVRRVGGESAIRVDVRLVCATHRPLRAMVGKGIFRRDLYYRIARLAVRVPPLCERPEDIVPLAEHFLRAMAPEVGARVLDESAVARLLAHRWPGNARELRNVLSSAAAASPARVLHADDLDRAIGRLGGTGPVALSGDGLASVLARHGGNVTAAARALGVPRSTLRDRLRRSGSGE